MVLYLSGKFLKLIFRRSQVFEKLVYLYKVALLILLQICSNICSYFINICQTFFRAATGARQVPGQMEAMWRGNGGTVCPLVLHSNDFKYQVMNI